MMPRMRQYSRVVNDQRMLMCEEKTRTSRRTRIYAVMGPNKDRLTQYSAKRLVDGHLCINIRVSMNIHDRNEYLRYPIGAALPSSIHSTNLVQGSQVRRDHVDTMGTDLGEPSALPVAFSGTPPLISSRTRQSM